MPEYLPQSVHGGKIDGSPDSRGHVDGRYAQDSSGPIHR
jgi:hypothetical protein